MAGQLSEALRSRFRPEPACRADVDGSFDEPSNDLASVRAEVERFREQARDRALELGDLRELLGEAELRREEGLRLVQQLKAQARLIAELRPQAASNKVALQALRQLQRQSQMEAVVDGGAGLRTSGRWFRSLARFSPRRRGGST